MRHTISSTEALLREAATEEHLFGTGGKSRTYLFPDAEPELIHYAVNLHNDLQLSKHLHATSHLTPDRRIMRDMHLGQPLAHLKQKKKAPRFLVLARQEPYEQYMSLENIRTLDSCAAISGREYVSLPERILSLGGNPFLPIFEQGYRIAEAGGFIDFNPANVFFDEGNNALRLVDQHETRFNPGESTKAALLRSAEALKWCVYYHDTSKEVREELCALVDEAAQRTIIKHQLGDKSSFSWRKPLQNMGLMQNPYYAQVAGIGDFSVSNSPRLFVEYLGEIERKANIPGREHLRG